MTKQKKNTPVKPKSLLFKVTVGIIIIAFIGFLLNNIFTQKENFQHKIVSTAEVYKFTKEGELTFRNKNGNAISIIDIEFADSENERARGLMYRDKMLENQGMLFVFPVQKMQSFWMHNTVLSLDIIFVNSDLEIVTIQRNAQPYSDKSLPSTKPAQYVIEVISGYTEKYNINEGDKVIFRKTN